MNFVGNGARLRDEDLPRIGYMIGVGEDEIHAFLDVETLGGGWDKRGRPKALFEPHVFFRNLSGTKRASAVSSGLAYASWGQKPYPTDSYPRIIAAMQIDETAALKATSWGIGQVLGENYVAAGYDNPQAMVRAFVEKGEAEQLEAAIRFIKFNRLDDELRAHNWAGFARGYNGSRYAEHGYHTKLAAAFKKWRAILDTPWSPEIKMADALHTPGVSPADPPTPIPVASVGETKVVRAGPGILEPPPLIVGNKPAPQPAPPAGFFARLASALGWRS